MNNISIDNVTYFNNTEHNYDKNSSNSGCNEDGAAYFWGIGIIVTIGLPLTLVAIFTLFSLVEKLWYIWLFVQIMFTAASFTLTNVFLQVRNDHVAPIYVINLLTSDLIQLCCLTIWVVECGSSVIISHIYVYGLLASVGFMVCISLERYLVIVWPLWYRFRRTIKVSVVVCVVVWTLPLVHILPRSFNVDFYITGTIFAVYLLLPFPLFIFFLGGTLKALSASLSVPSDEKRRIVGVLVVVLLIYTLLYLPFIISLLAEATSTDTIFTVLALILLSLSPLADLILYIFMRKGAIDKILASLCCCRMENNQQMNNMNDENMQSVSVM